ncbi:MAG: alpha/beta fold hydrolase [Acidimicrobiia bacterium]
MQRVATNGVEIAVDITGDLHAADAAPPVLLLHGWPDTHRLWRHQIAALEAVGIATIAPDLRGAGESDKPLDVAGYRMGSLVADVAGLLDALRVARVRLVGHDWGSALAWAFTAFLPHRVERLAALSVGHPAAFAAAGIEQRQRSWYMLLFQFEGIAEQWLSENDFARFRSWSSHPDIDDVCARLAEPSSLSASLNWYRANVAPVSLLKPPPELPAIDCPVMGVWSTRDFALTEQQMSASGDHVSGTWRYERVEGSGHWMPVEVPDTINDLLLDFLG